MAGDGRGGSLSDSPGFLRLAYRLNEDNGLVSVPIDPAVLPEFRPWQANLHSVEVDRPWHGAVPRGCVWGRSTRWDGSGTGAPWGR